MDQGNTPSANAAPLHLLLMSPFHSFSAIMGSLLFFKMPSMLIPQSLALPFLLSGVCFPRYMFGWLLITWVSVHMLSSQRGLPWPTSKIIASILPLAPGVPVWFCRGPLTQYTLGSHLLEKQSLTFWHQGPVPGSLSLLCLTFWYQFHIFSPLLKPPTPPSHPHCLLMALLPISLRKLKPQKRTSTSSHCHLHPSVYISVHRCCCP